MSMKTPRVKKAKWIPGKKKQETQSKAKVSKV